MAKVDPNQRSSAPNGSGEYNPDDWDTINSGLGEEFNFDDWTPGNTLVGNFVGTKEDVSVPDKSSSTGYRTTKAHQFFLPEQSPDSEPVFIWGSANLDSALAADTIRIGDMVRVTYLGKNSYNDKVSGEPRTSKQFKVQARKVVNA